MLDFFHELMRVSLIFFVVIALVVLAFMIAPKLKLTLPLTCFVLFCTILSPWAGAHEALQFHYDTKVVDVQFSLEPGRKQAVGVTVDHKGEVTTIGLTGPLRRMFTGSFKRQRNAMCL